MTIWLVSGYENPRAFLTEKAAREFFEGLYKSFSRDSGKNKFINESCRKGEDYFSFCQWVNQNTNIKNGTVTIQEILFDSSGENCGFYDTLDETCYCFNSPEAAKEGFTKYLTDRYLSDYDPEDSYDSEEELKRKVQKGIQDGIFRDPYDRTEFTTICDIY